MDVAVDGSASHQGRGGVAVFTARGSCASLSVELDFPQYTWLAMGSTHSVHILMSMNVKAIGSALTTSARLPRLLAEDDPPSSDEKEAAGLPVAGGCTYPNSTLA